METMKFDETNPAGDGAGRDGENRENSENNSNNEPAPKAPEGNVGDAGEAAEKAKNEAENQKTNEVDAASGASAGEMGAGGASQIQGGAEEKGEAEKRETEKETSSPEAKAAATYGTTVMPFQTSGNDGKNGENKRKKKLIAAGVALAVLILAVAGWQYWQYTQTPYYQQMKAVKMIDESLKESEKWGGKTPEETVSLFTEAIKKGDFELAAKYGDEEIKPELEKMKADGKIDQLIQWLKIGELREIQGFGGNDFNMTVKENGREVWILSMHKSKGGTWKIDEF